MGQVPLIVGNGRLASHLKHEFSLLGQPFLSWARGADSKDKLHLMCAGAGVILLALSDSGLEDFLSTFRDQIRTAYPDLPWVQFSGALDFSSSGVISAHPLASFPSGVKFELAVYKKIPWALTGDPAVFRLACPFWSDRKVFHVSIEDKPLYHALCVLVGNFSATLWNAVDQVAELKNWDRTMWVPLLETQLKGFVEGGSGAQTGPWVRSDLATQQKNLEALRSRSMALASLYQTGVETYRSLS